jgi:hypothetical protein
MSKKGKAKNTVNKAKHSRLVQQKKNKLREEKLLHKTRLKAIIRKVNEQKNQENDK